MSDGRLFRWTVPGGHGYSGWRLLLGRLAALDRQLSTGLSNVRDESLADGVLVTQLLDAVMRNSASSAMRSLGLAVSKALFSLLEKVVHLPSPPLVLLANSLRSLSLIANEKPR